MKVGIMRSLFKSLLIAVALVLLVKLMAFTSCTIPSAGMENTLYQGDRVIVNKWSYGFRVPFVSLFGLHRWGDSPVEKGDIVLFNNPLPRSLNEAVDRREIFINRCVGLPGDTLMMNGELIQTEDEVLSPDRKWIYAYPGEAEDKVVKAMEKNGISGNELVGYDAGNYLRSFSHYEMYLLKQELGRKVPFHCTQTGAAEGVHPFVIPAKGLSVRVYPWNAKLLRNTIVQHEGRRAEVKGDTLWIDGHVVTSYTFTKDYYWMASNNSMSLCDSRLFGFVPKDHVIGKAVWVWFSKDPERGLLEGYRFGRFFREVR